MRLLQAIPMVLMLVAGCAAPEHVEVAPLAAPGEVVATQAAADSRVQVTAAGGFASRPSQLSFEIQGLQLLVRTGDRPALEQLSLPLGDIQVPSQVLPPTGLSLRDLRLSVEQPVAASVIHEQHDALELTARAPLRLDWSLVLEDGTVYALGPARTTPVELDIQLSRQAERTIATVSARCQGTCWSLDGIASLSDGRVDLIADATVNPL